MARTFTYEFDELPLAILNGIEAGFVNGQAEIDYASSGDGWVIQGISLEGFGERINGRRQWPQVPAPEAIADIIRQRLNGEWYDKVYTAYSEKLAEDIECAAENYADMKREERMLEHVR